MNIHIGNVGRKVTTDSLTAVFSTYGDVSFSRIYSVTSAISNNRKALLIMPDDKKAATAIEQLNGSIVDGYPLTVAGTKPDIQFSFRLIYKQMRNRLQKTVAIPC